MATRKESDKCFQYLGLQKFFPIPMDDLLKMVKEKEPFAITDEEKTMLMNAIRSNCIYDQTDNDIVKQEKIAYYFARTDTTELYHNDQIPYDNLLFQFLPISDVSQNDPDYQVTHFYPQPVTRHIREQTPECPAASWLGFLFPTMSCTIIEQDEPEYSILYKKAIADNFQEVDWYTLPDQYKKYLPAKELPLESMRFLIQTKWFAPKTYSFDDWIYLD